MKTKITTLIALFLLTLGINAQVDRTQQPKAGPAPSINLGKPQTFELKNGLKVMVVENHKLPRVTASLILDNGPIFEGEKVGVMELSNGMMGNGTTSIPKDTFNEEVDFLGATLNAGTQGGSFNSLSKYFPRMMELLADAMQNPLFTQDEFDKLQAQIITGIESNENNVEEIASRVQNALVYGKNHPYGEFTTKKAIKNVTLDDVKQFHATYTKPNNGYLVIVGDVNFKDVKKLTKKHFAKWQKGDLPAYAIPEVKNVEKTEINFVNMPNAVQSNIAVMNTFDLKMGNPDYFAMLLANKIFGGGGEGRLFLNLREDKGYTYGAYSSITSNEKTAARLKSSAKVRNMVTDSAVVEFISELNKFRTTKVTEEELKNAKAAYVGNFVMALENPSTVASYALNIVRKNLPADFYETYLQKINAVTIDDIQRVAQKYFSVDNARIIVVGKAVDVIPNLEKLPYEIKYFDKEANKTEKPELTKPIPAGVTVKTVLDNYFNAIGGMDKVNEIKTTFITAETTMQGMNISMTTKTMVPNKQAVVVSGMGMVFQKSVFNGETGYNEQQGQRIDLKQEDIDKAKKEVVPFSELAYYNDPTITLEKIEPVNGSDAYVVKKGDNITIYYDVASGLKLKQVTKMEMMGQSINNIVEFKDYKEVDGVKFPHVTKIDAGMQKMDFTVKEIQINKNVSDEDFK